MINNAILGVIAGQILGSSPSYDNEVLLDSPAGYWKLDETAEFDLMVYDSSGNGKHGQRAAQTVRGLDGLVNGSPRSMRAIGDPSYIHMPADFGSFSSFTFEGWFNFDAINNQAHVATKWGRVSSDGNTFFLWFDSANRLNFLITMDGAGGGVKTLVGSSALTIGTLYHIAITFDGAMKLMAIYINGSVHASQTVTGVTLRVGTSSENLGIASKVFNNLTYDMIPSTRFGKFNVDNIAFYTQALSSARIAAHYSAGV